MNIHTHTHMKHIAAIALAMAGFAGSAQAVAPDLLKLEPGSYELVIPVNFRQGGWFDQFKLSLNQVSHVTGTITGLISVDQFQATTFDEMTGTTSIAAQVSSIDPATNLASFDFGVLSKTAMPEGMVGIPDPDFYTVNIAGLMRIQGPQPWGVKLTVNVAAVPEASTWLMMALGMGALAAVRRRRL